MLTVITTRLLGAAVMLLFAHVALAQSSPPASPEQRALGQQVMNQISEIVSLRTQMLAAQDELTACRSAATAAKDRPVEPPK